MSDEHADASQVAVPIIPPDAVVIEPYVTKAELDALEQRLTMTPPVTPEDLSDLEGKIAALLNAHASETHQIELRVGMIEGLKLAETMALAAEGAAAAAAAAAQSAADAADLVKTAHQAIQVLEDHEQVAELLENACITAARGIQAEVRSVIEETRQDVRKLAAGETESDRDE